MNSYSTFTPAESKLDNLFRALLKKIKGGWSVIDCKINKNENGLLFDIYDTHCHEDVYVGKTAATAVRQLVIRFKSELNIEDNSIKNLFAAAVKYDQSKLPKVKAIAFPVGQTLRGTFPALIGYKITGIIDLKHVGAHCVTAQVGDRLTRLIKFKSQYLAGFEPEYIEPTNADATHAQVELF